MFQYNMIIFYNYYVTPSVVLHAGYSNFFWLFIQLEITLYLLFLLPLRVRHVHLKKYRVILMYAYTHDTKLIARRQELGLYVMTDAPNLSAQLKGTDYVSALPSASYNF
jgi:hypothetical protein